MLKVKFVEENFRVELGTEPPTPPSEILVRIEEIWKSELKKQGAQLFNGSLFSIEQITDDKVKGCFIEYKFFLAQRRDPTLLQYLKIRALAITGLLVCNDGIVIGKRSGNVEQDAGCWELVPSGGVDGPIVVPNGAVDLSFTVLKELKEELGVDEKRVSLPLKPFVMVEDLEKHVVDIGVLTRVNMTASQVMSTFNNLENREYVALDVLPLNLLHDRENYSFLAPVSQAILSKSDCWITARKAPCGCTNP